MKAKTVLVRMLPRKGRAVRVGEGEEMPEEAKIASKVYRIEMPVDYYEKLKAEAKKENTTVERKIRSQYKYANQLPKEWKVTEI